MRIIVIYRADIYGGIGIDNRLPSVCPMDMFYFKAITNYTGFAQGSKNLLVFGNRTYSYSGVSVVSDNQRAVAVITRDPTHVTTTDPKLLIFTSMGDLMAHVSNAGYNNMFICGGREIYNLFWEYAFHNGIDYETMATIAETDYRASVHIPLTGVDNKSGVIHTYTPRLGGPVLKFYGRPVVSKYNDPYRDLLVGILALIIPDTLRETRNFSTYSAFGYTLRFNANTHILPPKKLMVDAVIAELVMFIRGITDTSYLRDKNIHIWDNDTKTTGWQMGPMYGYQWRNFNGMGIDQLQNVIEQIRENPNSRRHLIAGYNPIQADQGVLYPCHGNIIQFYVGNDGKLSLLQYQRSADVVLGLPFNILSYTMLLHMVANITGLNVGDVIINLGDYHVYSDHYDAVNKQLLLYNEYYAVTNTIGLPIISCTTKDLESVTESDFSVSHYYPVNYVSATLH